MVKHWFRKRLEDKGLMSNQNLTVRNCTRTYSLDDLHVRSDGSGRIVEAYAAVFSVRAEIIDQDGHYLEELPPTSFDKTISLKHQHGRPSGFSVLFNHGRTVDGTPADSLTMPIGVPEEVRADGKGVFTATRYLDNPIADGVLNAIKAGAIRAQSFSGRFRNSMRTYPDGRSQLPLITRNEVEMREYGPAVFAAYEGAEILGTRTEFFVRALLAQPPDRRLDWLQQFEGLSTPDFPESHNSRIGNLSGPAEKTHPGNSLRDVIRQRRSERGI